MGVICDGSDVEYFIRDPHFNVPMNQALDLLDDPGLVAEVARYQALEREAAVTKQLSQKFEGLATSVFKYFTEVQNDKARIALEVEGCKRRLKEGHAVERVHQAVIQLANSRVVGGRFYWQGLPGIREHPNRLTFPPHRRENDLAREACIPLDYRAALLKSAKDAGMTTRRRTNLCKWCGITGHFFKDCPTPHAKCYGKCYVRTDHVHYEPQLCGLEKAVRHRGRVRRRPAPRSGWEYETVVGNKMVPMQTED
jgi:hypothetical protein